MNDIKKLMERVDYIAKSIPLGVKETRDEIGISMSQWYRYMNDQSTPHAKTIRRIKAFIEKYKDIQ